MPLLVELSNFLLLYFTFSAFRGRTRHELDRAAIVRHVLLDSDKYLSQWRTRQVWRFEWFPFEGPGPQPADIFPERGKMIVTCYCT